MTAASTPTVESLLAEVERIRPVIEEHAAAGEEQGRLADEVWDAMIDAGLFRLLRPRKYGGLEVHPVEAYKVWEAVGKIDPPAGWNLAINSNIAVGMLSAMPAEASEEVLGRNPDAIFAATATPMAAGTKVDGGWRVSGQSRFASGSHRAEWFGRPFLVMDGDQPKQDPETGGPVPMTALMPASDTAIIEDSWNTTGMRATDSCDIEANDVFVPDHRVSPFAPTDYRAPGFEGPLYNAFHRWLFDGEAVPSLACASAAIDELVGIAGTTTRALDQEPLRERAMAQHHVARARALVDAARAYLYSTASATYEAAERREPRPPDVRAGGVLAGCFINEACVEAVDLVQQAAGTASIRVGQRIERLVRDVRTLAQHTQRSYVRYEAVGRMMYGMPHGFPVLDR